MKTIIQKIIYGLGVGLIYMIIAPTATYAQITADSIKANMNIYDRLRSKSDNGSKIIIEQDNKVVSVLNEHFRKSSSGKVMQGWRIRIFRDGTQAGRDKSEACEQQVRGSFPGLPVYRSYQAPYYYVSVGDFRNRDEAERMKKQISSLYPMASLIQTPINFPPL